MKSNKITALVVVAQYLWDESYILGYRFGAKRQNRRLRKKSQHLHLV